MNNGILMKELIRLIILLLLFTCLAYAQEIERHATQGYDIARTDILTEPESFNGRPTVF